MNEEGKITDCSNAGCGFFCCEFQQGNYIVTFPNELEQTTQNTDHLKVIDDNYHGGKKVVCTAKDRVNCDNGYKPIDCKMYPLYIKGDGMYIKGSKCPMSNLIVKKHKPLCDQWLQEYKDKNPNVDVDAFVSKVEMTGYEEFK